MLGVRLRFDGGDGDQDYFGESFIAERVIEPWFPSSIRRGPAWLMKVLTGRHHGEYLALTSRVEASLADQMETRGWLSVVVHRVPEPHSEAPGDNADPQAIGMAAAEVVRRSRPAIFAR